MKYWACTAKGSHKCEKYHFAVSALNLQDLNFFVSWSQCVSMFHRNRQIHLLSSFTALHGPCKMTQNMESRKHMLWIHMESMESNIMDLLCLPLAVEITMVTLAILQKKAFILLEPLQ